jgi:hypothetical protein
VKANIGQRTAERSYGVDGEELTALLGWNLPAPASRLERRQIQDRPVVE